MLINIDEILPVFSSDTLVRMYEELYHNSLFHSAHLVLAQLDKMVGRPESVRLISEYRHLIRSEHRLIG